MEKFNSFAKAVDDRLQRFLTDAHAGKCVLLRSSITGDELYATYLSAFPEGTNPIFRERTEHDCNCCKNYIRNVGTLQAVYPDRVSTIWSVDTGDFYATVGAELDAKLAYRYTADKKAGIAPVPYLVRSYDHIHVGARPNQDTHENITWHHFYAKLPDWLFVDGPAYSHIDAAITTSQAVLGWDLQAVKDVQELIAAGALYRGEQYSVAVRAAVDFLEDTETYPVIRVMLAALNVKHGPVTTIKNSSIGLLIEKYIETGSLETAVRSYEAVVAPHNYKRTTAVVTPRMIDAARKKVEDLGISDALSRRLALVEDIPVSAVRYSQAAARKVNPTPFDCLLESTRTLTTDIKGSVNMTIEEFMEKVIPTTQKLEMLVNPSDRSRIVTLTTAVDPEAPALFGWGNPFAWAYAGDVTDSVKQRVKTAGGMVDGDVRISLEWFDYDDLDLSMTLPFGTRERKVFFGHKKACNGNIQLDVDMNIHAETQKPVENIVIKRLDRAYDGRYAVEVNNYTRRSGKQDFNVELEVNGKLQVFSFKGSLHGLMPVISFEVKNGVVGEVRIAHQRIIPGAASTVGNLEGATWVPVEYIMDSPNCWGAVPGKHGIAHLFFMLEGMKTEEPVRAYFNEYLRADLQEHRKVFEVLGASGAMLETKGQRQLTGLGFNKQQGGTVTLRAVGNTTRTYNVSF